MSWLSALSVGSIVQNIAFYLLVLFLAHLNYCLIVAKSDQRRRKVVGPGLLTNRADLEDRVAGLENVLEHMANPLYMVDRDWNFTYINKKYEQVQGRDRAELLGRNVWELFPYGKECCYFEEYDRALRKQVSVHFEEFNSFNGMWVSATAYPIKTGLAICFRDITEEKIRRS